MRLRVEQIPTKNGAVDYEEWASLYDKMIDDGTIACVREWVGPAPAESAVSAVVAPLDDGFTGWHATSVKELEADKEPKQARSATEGDACLSHLHVFTGHTDLGGGVGMRR